MNLVDKRLTDIEQRLSRVERLTADWHSQTSSDPEAEKPKCPIPGCMCRYGEGMAEKPTCPKPLSPQIPPMEEENVI